MNFPITPQPLKQIYTFYIVLLFSVYSGLSFAQTKILRASLSTAPQTIQTGKYTVQQSIGHLGLIRTSEYNGNNAISGFLLPQTDAQNTKPITPQPSIEWQLYPNPFSTHINIDFSTAVSGNMQLLLFDVTGQLVMDKTIEAKQHQRIPMGHLGQGEYIIQVSVMNSTFSAQLLNYKTK